MTPESQNMDVDDENLTVAIAQILASDEESNGHPVLPADSRPSIEVWLELLLIDPVALRGHIRRLQDAVGTQFRHTDALDEERTQAVLSGQWENLADGELAALVLNPPALCCLQGLIDEEAPEAWRPAMTRHGCQLMAERGHSLPDFEEIARNLEASARPAAPKRKRRQQILLLGTGAVIAAAALIGFVLLRPTPLGAEVEVEVHWPRATRGDQAPLADNRGSFSVCISAHEPAYVHIIVRCQSGDLWIKQIGKGEYSARIEGRGSYGYDLWDNPSGNSGKGLLLSTHVLVIVARQPLTEQSLKTEIPDRICADSDEGVMRQLREVAARIQEKHHCDVIVKPIQSPAP